MDVIVRQLMKILSILTGLTATALIGSAIVSENDALTPDKKQVTTQGANRIQTQSPQSPTPPGIVQERKQEIIRIQTTNVNAASVQIRAGSGGTDPIPPQTISQ